MGILDRENVVKVVRAREIDNMQHAIMEKYGFEASKEYCSDLIIFLEALELPREEVEDVKGS